MSRRPPPSFRTIAPADETREAEEEARLEALARRRGIARLDRVQDDPPAELPKEPQGTVPEKPGEPGDAPATAVRRAPPSSPPAAPSLAGSQADKRPGSSVSRPVRQSARGAEASAGEVVPSEPVRALNIELPVSVIRRLKARALEEDCSVRHVVMQALLRDGVEIPPEAMVPDGRRKTR